MGQKHFFLTEEHRKEYDFKNKVNDKYGILRGPPKKPTYKPAYESTKHEILL